MGMKFAHFPESSLCGMLGGKEHRGKEHGWEKKMSREEKLFLLKLVDGNMSIFDENFSDADIEEAEEERMAVMEQISSLLPEKGRWKIMDQLEGAILNERGEACRLAYVLGMQMGARLVRALNADSLLTFHS